MTSIFQAPGLYADCRKIDDNDIEWRLALSGSRSWESDDLGATSTSATVRGLEPARYLVRLIVENEGGITTTSEEVTLEFGMDQQSVTVDVEYKLMESESSYCLLKYVESHFRCFYAQTQTATSAVT